MAESWFASSDKIVVDQLKLNAKKHYQIRKRDWVSGKIAQMKENSTLNWRSTSTTSPIKSYRFLPEVLNMDKSTNRRDLSPCWQPLIDIWKKNMTTSTQLYAPWVFSLQVRARRKSKTYSLARKKGRARVLQVHWRTKKIKKKYFGLQKHSAIPVQELFHRRCVERTCAQ